MQSGNEECLTSILRKYNGITTSEVISIANSEEFDDLCSGCSGGDDVIGAGARLIEQGIVKKELVKGKGYVWTLAKEV